MADEKKIIIDEDWKSQVEAEREQTAKAKAAPAEAPTSAADADSSEAADPPMPPASFEMLLTTLATEALVALGQVPHPVTGKIQAHRNQALAQHVLHRLTEAQVCTQRHHGQQLSAAHSDISWRPGHVARSRCHAHGAVERSRSLCSAAGHESSCSSGP